MGVRLTGFLKINTQRKVELKIIMGHSEDGWAYDLWINNHKDFGGTHYYYTRILGIQDIGSGIKIIEEFDNILQDVCEKISDSLGTKNIHIEVMSKGYDVYPKSYGTNHIKCYIDSGGVFLKKWL